MTDFKSQISAAFEKHYPSAANASGVGYLVLGDDQKIIRIDPIAQGILEASEAQCLGESIKMFLPPETTLSKHKVLVDGAMAAFAKAAKSGEASEISSMGKDSSGNTKVRTARTAAGKPIEIKVDIAMLPIGDKNYPMALITRAEEGIELNLTEEKRMVTQNIRLKIVAETSGVIHNEVSRWFGFFTGVFGTSRVGKIASLVATVSLFGAAIYGLLGFFKIIRPPTIQDFNLSPQPRSSVPIDPDDSALEPAKGHPNQKQLR